MHKNLYSNSHSNSEPSIEARLKDCKAGLKSLIASLQPYAPLDEIDLPRLDKIIAEVREYILLFDPVVNNESDVSLDDSEIAFLERSCHSVSTIHESLVSSIRNLLTARKALKTIEDSIRTNSGFFNTDLQNSYFLCLDKCRKAFIPALENIRI